MVGVLHINKPSKEDIEDLLRICGKEGICKVYNRSIKTVNRWLKEYELNVPYKMTEEHKAKLRESNIGKHHNLNEETLCKLSKLKKGVKLSEEHKRNISLGHLKYYENIENRQKLSESFKGRKHSEETKRKIGNSNKGKVYNKESREKISNSLKKYFKNEDKDHYVNRLKKCIISKRNNNTFNTSEPEENVYVLLESKYGKEDILRQYESNQYPYACDFYIKSLDLYIECHFGWMHGGKPFTTTDDIVYKKWDERKEQSNAYKQALYTWTDLDVRKLRCFIDNHLNFKIFYTYEEFLDWYK